MKHSYLTLFLLLSIGLFSCRKEGNDIDIKTYDQQQIDAYIKANGLTNMKRDMTDGDTTGIYYEILGQGSGTANLLDYDSKVSIVYSIRSLSGKYVTADTITNHSYNFVGRFMPKGLMLAIKNLAMYKGTRARFLIPSRLAYGVSGSGTGSTRLVGNESLDYYVNVINNQDDYDNVVIQKYMTANGLTGYEKIKTGPGTGVYYKIVKPGTGTAPITGMSTVTMKLLGTFLNGSVFQPNDTDANFSPSSLSLENTVVGFFEGVKLVTQGATLSIIVPSKLAYGTSGSTNQSTGALVIPANAIVKFDMDIITVTN